MNKQTHQFFTINGIIWIKDTSKEKKDKGNIQSELNIHIAINED